MSDLSNTQIVSLARRHRLKVDGIYLRDDIPKNVGIKDGFTVFNLDHRHQHDSGTHWTAAYASAEGCVYFDSFGMPPSIEIEEFIKRRFPAFYYNHRELQDYYAGTCGLWCLAFGNYVRHSPEHLVKAANDFINLFTKDTQENERILGRMGI